MSTLKGSVIVRNLRLTLPLGLDAWGRPGKAQPVIVSVHLQHKDLGPAAQNDDCSKTTSYSDICKAVIATHESEKPSAASMDSAHNRMLGSIKKFNGSMLTVETICPKGTLRIEGGYGLRSIGEEMMSNDPDMYTLLLRRADIYNDLKVACIIGVNPHERERKQMVVLNLELWRHDVAGDIQSLTEAQNDLEANRNHEAREKLMSDVIEYTENSSFETVEALAMQLLGIVGKPGLWSRAIVGVEKPGAVALADGCGVVLEQNWKKTS